MAAKNSHSKQKSTDQKKVASLQNKLKKVKKEVEELREELKEKNDKLLRCYADFQNYQRRMDKELENRKNETKEKYISELLDVYELLGKAYEDNNPKDGLKLILNNLECFFEKEKVKCIECLGKPFDHNIHHAVTSVEQEGVEDETVVDELKKGYWIDDKLLRPSQVVVSKKKEKQEEEKEC